MLKITKGNSEKESPDKAIYFDSDESFYDFCLNTEVVHHNEEGSHPCFSLDFTEAYKEAVKDEHTYFYIAKRNSTIVRRGCVNYRTITKRVERVIEWGELYNCDILEVPEGVTELRLDKIDIPTLHELHLPSTLTSVNSDIIEMMEEEEYVDWMWGIYVAPGTMDHFKQLLPPSVHHLIKENIKLSDALRNSPMFQLSLSSKELFHSNLLAWLAEDPDTRDLFVEVLKLFGLEDLRAIDLADGIRKDKYMVLREYNNFDFCICEKLKNWKEDSEEEYVPGRVVLVLENKFKSIPYEAQLKGYEEKVEDLNEEGMKNKKKSWYWKENNVMPQKWSDKFYKGEPIDKVGCHFVLLTLNKEVCGLNVGQNCKFGNWHVVSYKEYAQKLLADETIKNFKHEIILKHDIIRDYAGYVDKFCDCIYSKLNNLKPDVLLKKKWKEVLCPDPDLRAIRMDDIWQKLVANIILKQLRIAGEGKVVTKDEYYKLGLKVEDFLGGSGTGEVVVATGFSRGSGIIDMKIHIGDECLFGVQIQNGLYKRFLEASKKQVETDEKTRILFYEKKLEKFKNLNLFRYKTSQWIDAVNNVLTGDVSPKAKKNGTFKKGNAGLEGFGGYGKTFLAQWKYIDKDATVEDVINHIIEDCLNVKKNVKIISPLL